MLLTLLEMRACCVCSSDEGQRSHWTPFKTPAHPWIRSIRALLQARFKTIAHAETAVDELRSKSSEGKHGEVNVVSSRSAATDRNRLQRGCDVLHYFPPSVRRMGMTKI